MRHQSQSNVCFGNECVRISAVAVIASAVISTQNLLYKNWAYDPDICAVSRGIIDRREISGAYAPGYSADIRVIGPILISGALGPEDIRRYPGHMTRDPCAQPFPRP